MIFQLNQETPADANGVEPMIIPYQVSISSLALFWMFVIEERCGIRR